MRARDLEQIEMLAPIALDRWSEQALLVKACEELAELQVQVCKLIGGSPTTIDAVVDEIADVLIMTSRLRLRYGKMAVDDRVAYKLDRLEKALARLHPEAP